MHGHQLRLLAEEEHIDMWTDFTVGAIYGAIKRLTAEGLLEEVRLERSGNYPERQVYGITEAGRAALDVLRAAGLSTVTLRPDPFDLAMARLDPTQLDSFEATVRTRIETLQKMLRDRESLLAGVEKYLTAAEHTVLRHPLARLRAEIEWHQDVLEHLPEIIADEHKRNDADHV
jgi:DNA-binding PadR family transcriptional regulator